MTPSASLTISSRFSTASFFSIFATTKISRPFSLATFRAIRISSALWTNDTATMSILFSNPKCKCSRSSRVIAGTRVRSLGRFSPLPDGSISQIDRIPLPNSPRQVRIRDWDLAFGLGGFACQRYSVESSQVHGLCWEFANSELWSRQVLKYGYRTAKTMAYVPDRFDVLQVFFVGSV